MTFEVFYRDQFPQLSVLATVVCGDPGVGEDIAQEALFRAQSRWSSISLYDHPGAWVRRVTVHLALSRRRKLAREAAALIRLGTQRPQPQPDGLRGDSEIWKSVLSLPPRQRAVLVLFYYEDRSLADIASILRTSVSNVTSNLHKARRHLASLVDAGSYERSQL